VICSDAGRTLPGIHAMEKYLDDSVMRFSHQPYFLRMTAVLLAILFLSSCASLPSAGVKEPRIIVIRNRSGADIDTVTLRETGTRSHGALFGSISPVPNRVSQEYVRSNDPRPFPRTVAVEWIDNEGISHVRDVSVSHALRSATGSSDETLVFEIGPVEDVQVLIESNQK
jgi:hypothetical protein